MIDFGIKRYKKFPLIDIWGALLNVISWQMPVLLLSAFFTPQIVGFYALGATVLRMPINIIGNAIAQVFYQRASEEKNKHGVSQIALNTFKRLVAIGLFPIFMICIIGQDLFAILFGDIWIQAGLYIQILSPWIFFTLISSPLSMLFLVFERQGSLFIMHSIILLTRFVALYMGGILGNVYVALGSFSLVGIIVYCGLTCWNMRLVGIPLYVFAATFFKYFFYFCPFALCLLFLKYYFSVSSITMTSTGLGMICFYELVVLSKDNDFRMYMKNNKVMKLIDIKAHL
jgi:O-antigen/teichoic acid export membrane protein